MAERVRPYGLAAPLYRAAGWVCVLPLPYGRKAKPPVVRLSRTEKVSFAGHDGTDPSAEQTATWVRTRPSGNIALRMPHGVVGVDLDLYKPAGGASYAALVEELGPLPATWRSSAREDGSGIWFFTVPPAGVRWAEGRAGPGIELVHRTHRYAVVWPSRHPDLLGATYRWWTPAGALADRVPGPADLPALPPVWGRRLSEPPAPRPAAVDTHPGLASVRTGGGLAAASLARAVAELAAMRDGSGRNKALNRKAWALGGYVGADALDEQTVRAELLRAAEANGHLAKHGDLQTMATINSGLRAGMAKPRRTT